MHIVQLVVLISVFVTSLVYYCHKFEIRYVNLNRRPERRVYIEGEMDRVFPGVPRKRVPAVDALDLSADKLIKMGASVMKYYLNPPHDNSHRSSRPMKWGEVGCFLSHYQIWTEMAEKSLEMVLILEDDVKFVIEWEQFDIDHFHYDLNATIDEFIRHRGELLYLGRVKAGQDEFCAEKDVLYLVKPGHSWCTHAYFLTLEGAKKLISTGVLKQMMPVDDYLPLMYNRDILLYATKQMS